MRKIYIFFTIVLFSFCASALTLEEALTKAYNEDENQKLIRNEFLKEIEYFPQALAEFMPRISADINASDTKISRINAIRGDYSFRKNSQQQLSKTIRVVQPIYNGGKSIAALKAAQSAFRASRGGFYDKEQKVILDEITDYLDTVEAKEKYEISKINVKSFTTQLEAVKERFKLGESTDTEVASAQAELGNAEANQAVSYANYEGAKANFYRVFGTEPVGITMPIISSELPNSLEEFIEKSLLLNPKIDNARHLSVTTKANEWVAKGELLPSASFRVEYGRTNFTPQDDELVGVNTSNNNSKSISSSLSVNIPILSKGGAEYSEIRKAKYRTRESSIELDKQIKIITSSCKASWEAYKAAVLRINATNQAVKAAEVAHDGMVQEELLGSKTVLDVLAAQDSLNTKRQKRVEANKEFVLAGYKIKSLVGELTARSLKLPVDYFNPEQEFKKVKLKIIGF